jgi:membrane protein DedA with SNARE-associated domain
LFDLAGIAAGVLHYPVWRFLLICFIGKSIKGLALALAGAQWLELFDRFTH